MSRPFVKRVVLLAILHYLLFISLDGVIFFVSHIPPKAVNLDGPIRALQWVYEILRAPRALLRWLWPGEHTPSLLNWALTALNSLIWGLALAGLKCSWSKARQ